MEDSESDELFLKEKAEKIKSWLKDPCNLTFIGIILFAIAIRLYYFALTKSQPLWWDESDYMAYAKTLAGIPGGWIIAAQHNSLFPYLVAFFFKLGFSEVVAKFFLELLPSILIVFLVYKIAILMYKDKKIALISSFLMATFWVVLFNSFRFHLEVPAFLFIFIAIYIFFQGYEKRQKIFGKIDPKWAIPLTAIFFVLTYAMRRGFILFGAFFLVYMLFPFIIGILMSFLSLIFFKTDKAIIHFKSAIKSISFLVKDKYNWIAFILFIFLFFAVESFIFVDPISEVSGAYFTPETPVSLTPFTIFGVYFKSLSGSFWFSVLLPLFYLGVLVSLFSICFSFEYLRKKGTTKAKSDLFAMLSIVLTLAYFLFIQRTGAELGDPRWYFPLILGSFICISRGTVFLSDLFKKYSKHISIIIIILLIGYAGYYQVQHADFIIKTKVNSFDGIKQASLFVKDVSLPTDVIISISMPQPSYYAERTTLRFDKIEGFDNLAEDLRYQDITFDQFLSLLGDRNLRYMFVSFSEPNHPSWMKQQSQSQWQIPFMDTTIDFASGTQDIKDSKVYGGIEFRLIGIYGDVFVYEIIYLT